MMMMMILGRMNRLKGVSTTRFFGLCELAEKQMELSPFLFRKHFTNELSVSSVIVRETSCPCRACF